MLLLIELGLCIIVGLLALVRPETGDRWFTLFERKVSRLADRRHLAVLTVLLVALGMRLAILPIEPIPTPGIQDEFSYLLMSDTFAHGRLTNPPHRMSSHFETFQVLQHPTYVSKFYPGQGLALAIGQVFFGHAFWGVWLSMGLMCASFCWAFQAWMEPEWAFLGGILAILRLAIFSYWANSYLGGSVAGIGGALVLGAFPRIKRLRLSGALALGTGLALLANTRPYESLFYCLPLLFAVSVFVLSHRQRKCRQLLIRRTLLPVFGILVITAAFMGSYFWQTTGSAFRTPYMVDRESYYIVDFPWERLSPAVHFRFPEHETYYNSVVVHLYENSRSLAGFLIVQLAKLLRIWAFFIGPALTVPVLVLASLNGFKHWKISGKSKLLLVTFFVSLLGILLPIYFLEHYAAPMACLIYTLLLYAMRGLRTGSTTGTQLQFFFIRATVVICLVTFVACAIMLGVGVPTARTLPFDFRRSNFVREQIQNDLSKQGGKHLIMVRYSPSHKPNDEWVYNNADIDDSRIVWAREISPREDAELANYFKDRKIWTLEADETPPRLEPREIIPETANGGNR